MDHGFSDFIKKLRADTPRTLAISHPSMDIITAFSEAPEPLDYVLPGMISGSVGALISPGGVGKSMIALQLSVLIASGKDLLGIGVLPTGRVTYLPAEDPFPILHQRLYALGKYLSSNERRLVEDNLNIIPLIGDMPNLMHQKWFEEIESFARYSRLLILDTLRRFHQLEENSSSEMTELLGQMEKIALRTGCSVLFLHHTSKSSAFHASGDQQQASRGSSVLVDNVRWQGFLSPMSQLEAQKLGVSAQNQHQFVRFGVSKSNYSNRAVDKWLVRTAHGVLQPADLQASTNRRGQQRAEI